MLPSLSRAPRPTAGFGTLLFSAAARCCSPMEAALATGASQPQCQWRRRQPPVRQTRASSSSSSRWKMRQGRDRFVREAKVKGLKSRAAFKLLEMDSKYKFFKKGQLVVDLGYAPGSWSQVAMERTNPTGRVLGIDIIPTQPPKGVATIQGNFLSPQVRDMVRQFVVDVHRRQVEDAAAAATPTTIEGDGLEGEQTDVDESDFVTDQPSYIDKERHSAAQEKEELEWSASDMEGSTVREKRLVDVVLSDMSAPWPQTYGFYINSLSNPYRRMMNTSGTSFRDHAGSMDLCDAALNFANETLRSGGHFICKFYQGSEDKQLEMRLKKLFAKVHREKPEASRSESKEAYFVALRRKKDVDLRDLEGS